MSKSRELWVDNLKIFACILVVLGHFFQSMVSAEIINESFIYQWFNKTIYYFHVPLFFICSGYLYQKHTDLSTPSQWIRNVGSKALALMIPYLVFSVITWLLKNVFSDAVNQQTDGLVTSLLWKPISPYWYLFALFFIFVFIPIMKSKVLTVVVLFIAVASKVFMILPMGIDVYILSIVLDNIIWFVIGMCLCRFNIISILKRKCALVLAVIIAVLFGIFSVLLVRTGGYNPLFSFLMGFAACFVFVVLAIQTENLSVFAKISQLGAKYTFPVFLMHTIFAASFRSLLNKFGITNSYLHILVGLIVSFAGPVAAYMISSRIKIFDFFFYPNKYIKISKKNRG